MESLECRPKSMWSDQILQGGNQKGLIAFVVFACFVFGWVVGVMLFRVP